MKTLKNLWWLGAIAALAACNPYSDENKSPPNILEAFATAGTDVTVADGKLNATSGQWAIESTSTCVMDAGGAPAGAYVQPDSFLVWVKTDKLLSGASVQANASSCVPAGDWLTVMQTTTAGGPAADVTAGWYTCYQPGSPSATEGSSIVFYRSEPRSGGLAPGDVTAGSGWFSMANRDPNGFTTWVSGDAKELTTLTFTGTVKDQQGHDLKIDLAYTIDPDAGAVTLGLYQPPATYTPKDPTKPPKTMPDPIIGTSQGVAGTVAAPQVKLTWLEGECNAASGATYLLERKELTESAYTGLATFAPLATMAFTDDTSHGLAYGKQYSYRVRESISNGSGTPYVKTVSTRKVTVLLPPAAPTLTPAATKVTVAWAKVDGATSYTVQRNIANTSTYTTPIPGTTWVTVTTTTDPATLSVDDTGRPSGAHYFYRVIARAVVGTDSTGADVVGSSEPGEAAYVTVP
jgi:hypothetical protein